VLAGSEALPTLSIVERAERNPPATHLLDREQASVGGDDRDGLLACPAVTQGPWAAEAAIYSEIAASLSLWTLARRCVLAGSEAFPPFQ
jgi:hypothetical protein